MSVSARVCVDLQFLFMNIHGESKEPVVITQAFSFHSSKKNI